MLLDALARERNDDVLLLQVLAATPLPDEPQALAHSMSTAAEVVRELQHADWDMLRSARELAEGAAILDELARVAVQEQLHAPLGGGLRAAAAAVRKALLQHRTAPPSESVGPPAATPPLPTPPSSPGQSGPTTTSTHPVPTHPDQIALDIDADHADAKLPNLMAELGAALRAHPGKKLHVRWWLE
jgi:hypothetical protein